MGTGGDATGSGVDPFGVNMTSEKPGGGLGFLEGGGGGTRVIFRSEADVDIDEGDGVRTGESNVMTGFLCGGGGGTLLTASGSFVS